MKDVPRRPEESTLPEKQPIRESISAASIREPSIHSGPTPISQMSGHHGGPPSIHTGPTPVHHGGSMHPSGHVHPMYRQEGLQSQQHYMMNRHYPMYPEQPSPTGMMGTPMMDRQRVGPVMMRGNYPPGQIVPSAVRQGPIMEQGYRAAPQEYAGYRAAPPTEDNYRYNNAPGPSASMDY
jgi:hypothetical protein